MADGTSPDPCATNLSSNNLRHSGLEKGRAHLCAVRQHWLKGRIALQPCRRNLSASHVYFGCSSDRLRVTNVGLVRHRGDQIHNT
jgi:hypothetical protein